MTVPAGIKKWLNKPDTRKLITFFGEKRLAVGSANYLRNNNCTVTITNDTKGVYVLTATIKEDYYIP